MRHYHNILQKLEAFGRKYYTKSLLKGILLFLAFGTLFALILISLEYWLWLDTTGRLLMFIAGALVLMYLFIWQIGIPLIYLFRLKKGITHKQASQIIGRHFPEVGDKLYNLFDLADSEEQSELLQASIDQRSFKLSPIPFQNAVDLRENLKYLKYLAIPLLLVGIIYLSGNLSEFIGSYQRVVNYDLAYEPPAPFAFVLLNEEVELLENQPYQLQVTTRGTAIPEDVYMVMEGKEYLLRNDGGIYEYTLSPPLKDATFYFKGGGVQSKRYYLDALEVPVMEGFEMELDYPAYLGLSPERIKGTGNAVIPEGTKVIWRIRGKNTESISFSDRDTVMAFQEENGLFELTKRLNKATEYTIRTSNEHVSNFEELAFELEVVRDAFPKIRVNQAKDTLNPNNVYYGGIVEDDHGLRNLQLVCHPKGREQEQQVVELGPLNDVVHEFYYTFPDGLEVVPDEVYEYYFEVRDNDGLRGGKKTKSQTFTTMIYNETSVKEQRLYNQQELIKDLDNSVEQFREQQKALEEINRSQKEKNNLNFNDKRQVQDFLKKQQAQEQMMEKFSRQLKDNLAQEEQSDPVNELLKERLERQEEEARRNEKLLKELEKVADKINKEELAKRLEEVAKKQQNNKRSLEQLVELTKRYYVTEKTAQLAKQLNELGEKQEGEGKKQELQPKPQEDVNKQFDELRKELDTLEKDNQKLKKPLKINRDQKNEDLIDREQERVLDKLKNESARDNDENIEQAPAEGGVKSRQQNLGRKIKEMAEELQQAAAAGAGGSSVAEDAEMLRQILDNLVTFSFKQEVMFDQLQEVNAELGLFSETVRGQQQLRKLFEHVDDSLFALSLRRAELSEVVNEQITEVYYNIDKSLESIAENRIYQGVSYQQYVLNAANTLADLLADILENMQQSLSPGAGQGQGMQLQDIIISQEELKKRMEKNGSGDSGKEGEEEGKKGQEGQEGQAQGEQGNEERERGKQGNRQGGEEGQGTKNGKDDPNGEGQMSEEQLRELYEIYKLQEEIKNQLEKQLQDMISNEDRKLANRILRQMQMFQEDLLENGITKRTKDRLNAINYQLLKLKDAALKQGEKSERESRTGKQEYSNPLRFTQNWENKQLPQIEILDRQALPLRQKYKQRVQRYFNRND